MERVAFLGFVLPDEMFARLLERDRGMPVQTQKFGWAVVDALRSGGLAVTPISTEPVMDFPNNSRILFRGRRFEVGGLQGVATPFINLTGLKHLTRFASSYRHLATCSKGSPLDAVVVHGVNSALLWAAIAFGRTATVPVVVVVTDPPSLRTRFDNAVTWRLKQLDRWIITTALRRTAGVVALAPRLAEDFAPGVPTLVMEGISSATSPAKDVSDSRPRNVAHPVVTSRGPSLVVYAGGVDRAYGVLDLVAAAESSNGWSLEVYGRGPDAAVVEAAAARSPKVRYGGLVGDEELRQIYARADLLVNPRRLGGEVVTYSFPSKLIEYLATGTPVMTTRLPTLPPDYDPHIWFTDEGTKALLASIDAFFEIPETTRQAQGLSARTFIISTRGVEAQGLRLMQFLEEVAGSHKAR